MSNKRVIKDDEEYERAVTQKFVMAAELDDPLSGMSPADRTRKMAIYDRTCELIVKYRRGRLVQEFPGLREKYQILNQEFQEFDQEVEAQPITEPEQATPTNATPELIEPPNQSHEPVPSKPKPNLSSWLDD